MGNQAMPLGRGLGCLRVADLYEFSLPWSVCTAFLLVRPSKAAMRPQATLLALARTPYEPDVMLLRFA
jgi:hypothetical protein